MAVCGEFRGEVAADHGGWVGGRTGVYRVLLSRAESRTLVLGVVECGWLGGYWVGGEGGMGVGDG